MRSLAWALHHSKRRGVDRTHTDSNASGTMTTPPTPPPAREPNSPARAVSVRPATPGDVPTILRFIRELAEYEQSPDQVVATEASIHRNLFGTGFGRGPVAECLIGELDGQPAGFAVYFMNFSTWVSEAGIYLEDLFVSPDARGSGLGKRLLVELATIARDRGCRRMDWMVLDWNTSAQGFYRGIGAEPLEIWTVWRMRHDAIATLAQSK
jgi:GNAT superfamily N-acetyltransferase